MKIKRVNVFDRDFMMSISNTGSGTLAYPISNKIMFMMEISNNNCAEHFVSKVISLKHNHG